MTLPSRCEREYCRVTVLEKYEKLEALHRRIVYLEKEVRAHWSKSLEQEARISELEEKLKEKEPPDA